MDYSESETIDTEILRPRVKRFYQNITQKFISKQDRYPNILRDDSNIPGYSAANRRAVASSTSLVLKKTSQREILEKYSVISYTSLLRANRNPSSELSIHTSDKPLIKVTVIPKSPQTQTTKHRRRIPTVKKIQNTLSNHENSIHTKNLYLVVAGRTKEKIYEIKTTGSAEFSADRTHLRAHDEEISIKDRSSIKQITESLNMDKKKKKGKFRKESKRSEVNPQLESIDRHHDCRCNTTHEDRNIDERKSRVRIFGQVGLTEDERYVVKCDAMVDGEPIMTKIVSEKIRPRQYAVNDITEPIKYRNNYDAMACFGGYCENDNCRSLRDSNIQVDLIDSNENPNSNVFRSVENQGTQVNFNLCQINNNIFTPKRNQTIQCNYVNVPKTMNITENESECNVVKETQSPLVIISVYPKQESNEAKTVKNTVFTNTRPTSPINTTNVVHNIHLNRNERGFKDFEKRNDRSPKPSLSASPNKKNFDVQPKLKDMYRTDTKSPRTRANSPNWSAVCSNKGKMTQINRIQTNSNPKTTDESSMFTTKNMQKIDHILMSRGNRTNSEIKKALVDDYTRRITETINKYPDKSPQLEASKAKINIDSENEYYDVHFQQGQRTTDLKIRKTIKEAASQNHEYNERSASPENLYLVPEKGPRRKSVSPSKNAHKDTYPKNMGIRNSKLNIRDSIEISHKRESRPIKKDAQTHKTKKQNACCRDTDFLAKRV